MTASEQPVFISYSRKDYYFAESLVFHLMSRDVPAWLDVKNLKPGVDWERDLETALAACSCVVLVISSNALQSVNVRGEWQRAVNLGKRIIVARFRGVRLPDELKSSEIVDFRGSFQAGLDRLIERVGADPAATRPADVATRFSLPFCFPPGVAAFAAILTLPVLGYVALILWKGDSQGGTLPYPATIALWFVAVSSFLWFFCGSFLKRRMGMTRLAACLGGLAALYAYPICRLFIFGPAGLDSYDTGIIRSIVEHWRVGLIFCAIPVLGLATLVLVRPEDLLRWMPTGKIWNRYRIGRAPKISAEIGDSASALHRLERFHLIHDQPDAPAAARLRQELNSAGAIETPPDDPATTAVLLLTNRTRTPWLNEQAGHLKGELLTVVATGISLPGTLDWLWRREWIDFRRWEFGPPKWQRGLPGVPESVIHPKVPKPVKQSHHVLCAFGALLFVLAGTVMDSAPQGTVSLQQTARFAAGVIGWLFVLPARGLVRRKISPTRYAQWIGPIAAVAVVSGLIALYFYVHVYRDWVRALPALAFLLAAPFLLRRLHPAVAFWFPLPDPQKENSIARLTPGRDWQTFFLWVLYLFAWTSLLSKS